MQNKNKVQSSAQQRYCWLWKTNGPTDHRCQKSFFFCNGKKEGNMQPWPLACFEVPRRSATSCLREISSQTAPATIWSHQWLGSKEPACRSCMSEFSRARKWMMMMNWCPLSRGYEKTKVERLRGELLSLTDFGVEGTLEEREAKVEQVFTMPWKENIAAPFLACMSSFIFYPPSCWASTLIITNVHHFTVLRRRDSRVEEQTEDVWAKSACNSGLIIKASNSGRIIIARGHSKFWWYHRNFDQTCRRTDGFARGFAH